MNIKVHVKSVKAGETVVQYDVVSMLGEILAEISIGGKGELVFGEEFNQLALLYYTVGDAWVCIETASGGLSTPKSMMTLLRESAAAMAARSLEITNIRPQFLPLYGRLYNEEVENLYAWAALNA